MVAQLFLEDQGQPNDWCSGPLVRRQRWMIIQSIQSNMMNPIVYRFKASYLNCKIKEPGIMYVFMCKNDTNLFIYTYYVDVYIKTTIKTMPIHP